MATPPTIGLPTQPVAAHLNCRGMALASLSALKTKNRSLELQPFVGFYVGQILKINVTY